MRGRPTAGAVIVMTLTLVGAAWLGPACGLTGSDASSRLASVSNLCRASSLHALFRGFHGSTDSLAGAIVVTNGGPRPCSISGSARSVGLIDDGGDTVTARSEALDTPPDAGPIELEPGVPLPTFGAPPMPGSAWFTLNWSNWCSTASPVVRSVLVVLPAGGSISAPLDPALPDWAVGPPAPACSNARQSSTVSFSRFQAAVT